VLVTVASVLLFSTDGVRRIGEIPTGFPELVLPTFTGDMLRSMLADALVLGTLGCIDTLLTAVIADSLTRKEHDSNRELIGQGMGNVVSGMFGALPGAGATMGTVVNVQVGAGSPVSGILRALILLLVVLWLAPLTASIPMAALAGIAVYVGLNILDWSFIKRVHRVSLAPTVIMYGVLLLTVFVDLIYAVGIGVFLANVLTIERLSRVQERNIKAISDADDDVPLGDEERALLDRAGGQLLFFYLSGPMIFGVSKAIARQHAAVNQYRAMVIDLSAVTMIDVTVALALENAIRDALEAQCEVFLFCPNSQTMDQFERLDIGRWLDADHVVTSRMEALERGLDAITRQPPENGAVLVEDV